MSISSSQPGLLRKLITVVLERRIPYRIARNWSRAPQRSMLWRLARYLYSKPSAFFKYFGLFPLPVQSTTHEQFRCLKFDEVRPFSPRALPKSVHADEDWIRWTSGLPEQLRSPAIPSCHTVFIPNGFADAAGNVFSEDGYLVIGASLPVRKDINEYYTPFRIKPPIYRAKSVAAVTSSLQGNYYHWLFELLPRIHMLRCQGLETSQLFAQAKHKFQTEALAWLGIPDAQLINTEAYEFVSASELVVPFHNIGPRLAHPRWTCDFLRRAFLPIAEQERSPKPMRRLYVSRGDAEWRRVINEQEVMEVLEPLGFQSVTLGQSSFTEQIRLFRDAEIVVAPHGAALSNLVFCQPGARVIEFQPLKLANCFFELSRSLGLDYYYIKSATGPSDPLNNHQEITIAITDLRATLQLAGIS